MEKSVISHLLSPQKNKMNMVVQEKKLISVLVISNITLILWIFFKDTNYHEIPVEKTAFSEFDEKEIQSKPFMMSKLLSPASAKEPYANIPRGTGDLSKSKVISPKIAKKAKTKKIAKKIDSLSQNIIEVQNSTEEIHRRNNFITDFDETSDNAETDQWMRLNATRSNNNGHINNLDAHPVEFNETSHFNIDKIETIQEISEEFVTGTWDVYTDSSGEIYEIIGTENNNNNVIQLEGDEEFTGYRKIFDKPITDKNTIEWEMNYAEDYTVYVSLETTQGHRYLYYTASDFDDLDTNFDYSDAEINDAEIDENEYIHHGLNEETKNGQWHTVSRNYVEDLQDAQPDNTVISADAFLIRGSGFVVDELKALNR